MSLKLISRGAAALLLTASIASAQLMNSKSLDVIRVEKTGISAGKIDSLAKMLGEQQFRGKKIDDQTMTQLRYAVIDNLVGQELIKLECKKQGIKVPVINTASGKTAFAGNMFDLLRPRGRQTQNMMMIALRPHIPAGLAPDRRPVLRK